MDTKGFPSLSNNLKFYKDKIPYTPKNSTHVSISVKKIKMLVSETQF